MRRLFTTQEIGLSRSALRWGEEKGRWRHVDRNVWAEGPEEPSPLDRARAAALATGGVASHHLAGVLHRLDGVRLDGPWLTVPPGASSGRPGVRRRTLGSAHVLVVGGVPCTDGLLTIVDLASSLAEGIWEQALESVLRKGLTTVDAVGNATAGRGRGALLAQGVLRLRAPGTVPTGSLLETLTVQLARTVPGLAEPVRQCRIVNAYGEFVALVDLAWPDLGLFVELDGQHHAGQPVYDARRETAVVAATGWLCGRFTWTEVVRYPVSTARRLAALAEQARRRPLQIQPARSSTAMLAQPRSSSATR